jgi:hypothetical protein
MGLPAAPEEIYCSSYSAAGYLKSIGFKRKVERVGMSGLWEWAVGAWPAESIDSCCSDLSAVGCCERTMNAALQCHRPPQLDML